MLKRNREEIKPATQPQQSIQTIIGADTFFEGVITTKTPMRIDGTLKGDINSESTLIIGATGEIQGTVKANDLYIAGKINGEVTVENKTEFVSGGYLFGDLNTTDLIMENGASFDGKCKTKNQSEENTPIKLIGDPPKNL